jgi:hypothetical protein
MAIRLFSEITNVVVNLTQHGYAPTHNGAKAARFRDQCLSLEWFGSRPEAKVLIEKWRRHYNEVRPPISRRTNSWLGERPAPRRFSLRRKQRGLSWLLQ